MTVDEVGKLIKLLEAVYPTNFNLKDRASTLGMWAIILRDNGYDDIKDAVYIYAHTSGSAYPPTISELIAISTKMREAPHNYPNEIEAWSLVRKAIGNSIYNSENEYNKLPDVIQETIGSSSQLRYWAETDYATIESVISSNFQRAYRSVVARREELAKIPAPVRERLNAIRAKALNETKDKIVLAAV